MEITITDSSFRFCKNCKQETRHWEGFSSVEGEFHKTHTCEECERTIVMTEVVKAN